MRALKAAVLIGFGIAIGAIGSMSASSPTQVPSTPLCSLPDKGTYSPGAIVRHEGRLSLLLRVRLRHETVERRLDQNAAGLDCR